MAEITTSKTTIWAPTPQARMLHGGVAPQAMGLTYPTQRTTLSAERRRRREILSPCRAWAFAFRTHLPGISSRATTSEQTPQARKLWGRPPESRLTRTPTPALIRQLAGRIQAQATSFPRAAAVPATSY